MRYDQWNTDEPAPKATGTDRGSVRFLIFLVLATIATGCLLSPRLGLVTGTGTLLTAGMLLWLTTGILTFFFDSWFARPTYGTSGAIGVAYLWIVIRIIVGAVFTVLTVSHTLPYATGLYVGAAVLAVIDAVFVHMNL